MNQVVLASLMLLRNHLSLTWICFDMVHLVEIFRNKKLLEGKQTHKRNKSQLK